MGKSATPNRARPGNPAAPRLNLLREPHVGVELKGGERRGASLPEVLALLGRDEIVAFVALQAHQQHGWHAFLVQLAAIALHHGAETSARQTTARWTELLVALTKCEEPWCLVVEELSRPAFMQPPVPEGTLAGFKEAQRHPDELDVLVTAKNHDVKTARIAFPRPEHWVYALVTLQTMEGFSGATRYGIARMNGGQASRAIVGLVRALSPGARFLRDVPILLENRDAIAKAHGYPRRGGLALLWCEEWEGTERLGMEELDPLFIDTCRRVRLAEADGWVVAARAGTEVERVESKALRGNTGDPWAPIDAKEGKSFTATGAGFSYRVVQRLLSDDFAPGAALIPAAGETDVLFVGSVLARGQGKTAGFHERILPIPGRVTSILRGSNERSALGRLAKERVDVVSTVQNRVLRPALKVLLQGGPEKLTVDDERPDAWVRAHDAAVDAVFFERLWADVDRDPGEAARDWAQLVISLARRQLDAAIEGAPVPAARRYRAIATAERVFEGATRNHVAIAHSLREVEHVR